MKYNIYKLCFSTPIHIGNGRLENTASTIAADTFFSALCIEAMSLYSEQQINLLLEKVKNSDIVFSDLLPFVKDKLYIPKPLMKITSQKDSDISEKKLYKKLKYIAIDSLDTYLKGELNPQDESREFSALGASSVRTMSSSLDDEKSLLGEMLPYSIGLYTFNKNCGLYVIVGVKSEEDKSIFEELLNSLSFSGIGGKRNSGFGKFTVEKSVLPSAVANKIGTKNGGILLSTAMAKEEELEDVLAGSKYLLKRRAGFSYSVNDKVTFRKRDFYSFSSGSYFKKAFTGDVFDVATKQNHPVYRYAKPLFLEV